MSPRFTTYAIIFFPGLCCGLEADLSLKLWWCLFRLSVSLCYCCPFPGTLGTPSEQKQLERRCFLIPNPIILIQWLENLESERKRRAKRKEESMKREETSRGKRRWEKEKGRDSTWLFSFVLLKNIYLFICSMWDPVPWPRIEPRPPAWGVWWSFSHWILGIVTLPSSFQV